MNDDPVWNSIARKLAGECREGDDLLIASWLEKSPANQKILSHLKKLWSAGHSSREPGAEGGWHAGNTCEEPGTEGVWHVGQASAESDRSTHWNAGITTGNIELNRLRQLFVVKRDRYHKQQRRQLFRYQSLKMASAIIALVATTFLVVHLFRSDRPDGAATREIYVPKGNRSFVQLPDGSTVWISNDSRLTYPATFQPGSREVTLSGEAFFEVATDPESPFIVHLEKSQICVPGTKFLVVAYPGDSLITTSLLEGKIEMEVGIYGYGSTAQKHELLPLDHLVYDKSSESVTRTVVKSEFFDQWRAGVFSFRNESLEDLAVWIDRIYDVQLVLLDSASRKKHFSGTINRKDDVQVLMDALVRTSVDPIEYWEAENKIFLRVKSSLKR